MSTGPATVDLRGVVRGFQRMRDSMARAAESMLIWGGVYLIRPSRHDLAVRRKLATQQRIIARRAARRRRRSTP